MSSSTTKTDWGAVEVRLELHHEFEPLEQRWRDLQKCGICSFYQSYDWCKVWYRHIGQPKNARLMIVSAVTETAECAFILPLALQKIQGANIVTWIGIPELTYGAGIYDEGFFNDHAGQMERIWPKIVKLLAPADAIWLSEQPETLNKMANPLAFSFTQTNPNRGYCTALSENYNDLFARKRSSASRRSIRKRDKKLLASGDVTFGLPRDRQETCDVIDKMLEHQRQRLGAKGVTDFYSENRKHFLHGLSALRADDGNRLLLAYHLKIDEQIIAVMLGGNFRNTYWALIASLDPDDRYHAMSPGDFALRGTIKDLCAKGFSALDFASGDTEYKLHWQDHSVQLFDTLIALTLKGRLWAMVRAARIYLKSAIKKNNHLFSLALKIRKMLFSR